MTEENKRMLVTAVILCIVGYALMAAGKALAEEDYRRSLGDGSLEPCVLP